MYASLSSLPTPALRADWKVGLMIVSRYMKSMAGLGPYAPVLPNPTLGLLDFLGITDPWMRRLADLECYLLSGMDAGGTVAAEFAAVFGASDDLKQSEFPKGGAEEITNALARAVTKRGGDIRLKSHVDRVLIEDGAAVGVRLKSGEEVRAPVVLSNASVWDTYNHLIPPGAVPQKEREEAIGTPHSESFMHLHLGIRADGLDLSELGGHHVVVRDETKPIDEPGNVCMISIATVWEPDMAPEGYHCVHAYTMEPFDGWERGQGYEAKKIERSAKLYEALERIIPDVRDRVELEMIGKPADASALDATPQGDLRRGDSRAGDVPGTGDGRQGVVSRGRQLRAGGGPPRGGVQRRHRRQHPRRHRPALQAHGRGGRHRQESRAVRGAVSDARTRRRVRGARRA